MSFPLKMIFGVTFVPARTQWLVWSGLQARYMSQQHVSSLESPAARRVAHSSPVLA